MKIFLVQQWTTSASGGTPGNYWKYIHGRNGASGAILRLDSSSDSNDVVRAGRDPDFFELLKATINAGSIAKVGSSVPTEAGVQTDRLQS